MERILIDFQGGTHGNFLEFLLNQFYYSIEWEDPFTDLGTSHKKIYNLHTVKFFAGHFTSSKVSKVSENIFLSSNNIILITIEPQDLLLVMSVSLLRAGDTNISDDLLEIDTFNKLDRYIFYKSMLNRMITSYNLKCNKENPNIPRYILREFFKFGFRTPEINGFIKTQNNSLTQLHGKNVYFMPFASFYNYDTLFEQLNKIYNYFQLDVIVDKLILKNLHTKFFNKIPYTNITNICNQVIDAVDTKQIIDIPKLSMLQESYINSQIEKKYNIEMPFVQQEYFKNTEDIIQYIREKLNG